MSTTLIRNVRIITMNRNRDILQGHILIEHDRIKSVGAEEFAADNVIEGRGRTVIPGLVQTHIHLCQSLFRGQADDLDLMDWLQLRIWPLEAAHDPESVHVSALLGIAELFRGGTTSIVDMETVRYTDSAFYAIEQSGIRAISGKCMMDWGPDVPPGLSESTDDSLRESVDLLEKWHGGCDGRLSYAFTPRFAVSCTEELLKQVGTLARKYKVKIHTHASENQDEIALVEREHGMRNVAYLDRLGITGDDLILAHCIWLDDREMEILQEKRVKVAHCPSCNTKLGSGLARVPEMLARGISVSLGADGAPSNNNLDVFNEMRMAAFIQKPRHGPTAMPARQVFEMATLGGAEAMGLADEIGSLEPGKKADLAILDLDRIHCTPAGPDPYAQLVYQVRSSDVVLTMVDGRIVYRDGVLTTMDEPDLIRQANKLLKRVYVRAGL